MRYKKGDTVILNNGTVCRIEDYLGLCSYRGVREYGRSCYFSDFDIDHEATEKLGADEVWNLHIKAQPCWDKHIEGKRKEIGWQHSKYVIEQKKTKRKYPISSDVKMPLPAWQAYWDMSKSTTLMTGLRSLIDDGVEVFYVKQEECTPFEKARDKFLADHPDVYGVWRKGDRTTCKLVDGDVGRVNRFHKDENDDTVAIYEAYVKALKVPCVLWE